MKNYYQKQSKSSKNLALEKEEKELSLIYKREDEQARLAKMEQKRILNEEKERERLLLKIAEKD